MRLESVLVVLLLFQTAFAGITTIAPNTGLCTCSQIQYQSDCLAVSIPSGNLQVPPTTCTWTPNTTATGTQAKGSCATTIIVAAAPIATYCSTITVANCPKTTGCALPDGKTCQALTACSSYVFTTNAACVAISTLCTTDGTQCAFKQPCSFYTANIANCGLYPSTSGTGTCKVSGTTCVDQTCTDAAITLTTDAACNTFLAGCVSSGAGCIAAHVPCATQTGNATTCPTFIGLVPSEGLCKYSGSGNACAARTCADAANTLTTDAACASYLPGCVSSGAGCVNVHVSCASQTGTAFTCPIQIGLVPSEGLCKYGSGTSCAARTCADAPATTNTNALCIAYLPSCLYTIGKGCVSIVQTCSQLPFSLGCSTIQNTSGVACINNTSVNPAVACREIICTDNTTATTTAACNVNGLTGCVTNGAGCVPSTSFTCTSYKGTNAQCAVYFGSAGPCKGNALDATTSQACLAQTCADGASNLNTNKACAAIQTGCVTTGYGCVSSLPLCSTYTPSTTNLCDNYLGSDGPCTLASGATACSVRTCAGAVNVITTTNTGCQAWMPYVSSSQPGCVTNGTTCINGGLCTNLSQTSCTGYNTCTFIKSCFFNTLCTNYTNQTLCVSNTGRYGRSCTWTGTACAATACPSSSATMISDTACQGTGTTATPGCYYTGPGTTSCQDGRTATCAQFVGDNSFNANVGCAMLFAGQCASSNPASTAQAACVTRTCAGFYQTKADITTNTICAAWLTGCITNGYQGCVAQYTTTDICSSYVGTQKTCNTTFANLNNPNGTPSVQCFNIASATVSTLCVVKTAALIAQTTANQVWTDAQCAAVFTGAISSQAVIPLVGSLGVCISNTTSCLSLSGNISQCSAFVNLTSGKCTKNFAFCYPIAVPVCSNLTFTTIKTCQAQHYTCTWASGTKCTTLDLCTNYIATPANCNALFDKNGYKCGSNSNVSAPCIYGNFCTDFNTGGSTTAITYCATLTDALGNTCSAATNTDLVCGYPTTGNRVLLGNGQCTAGQTIINGKCVAYTLPCTNLSGFYFQSLNNCVAANSSCTWNKGGTTCIATGACTSYSLPSAPADAIIGNAYCTQYKGTTGVCQLIGVSIGAQPTTCQEPAALCTAYTPTSTGQTTLTQAICAKFQNANRQYCGVVSDGSTCAEPTSCTSINSTADITGAIACQSNVDSTTFTPCSQSTASQTTCQSGAANCTGYSPTSGSTAIQSAALCQGYFTAAGVQCGFISGSATCTNRTCADFGLSLSTCSAYLSTCVWSAAGACVAISTINTCSQYPGTSSAICSVLFDNKGRQCNWVSGTVCSDMQCNQVSTTGGSTHTACQQLNFGCTAASPLTANQCQTIQTSCFKYIVLAANMADCAQFYDSKFIRCSAPSTAPTVSGPCTYGTTLPTSSITAANCNNPSWTYTAGATPTCTGTSTIVASCSTTSAIGATFAAQLAYCQSLTSGVYGTSCFFSQFDTTGIAATKCVDSVTGTGTNLIYPPNCAVANISNTPAGGTASAGTGSDADCQAFFTSCTATLTSAVSGTIASPCAPASCSMVSTTVAISTSACKTFMSTCIWNGLTACVPNTTPCAQLTGTVTSCATFMGYVSPNVFAPCYQANAAATTTPALCVQLTCAVAPTTIITNAGCETWFPSSYNSAYNSKTNPGPNLNCVWSGTTGCVSPQACASFIGTAITCPTFTATDGPCKAGTGANCAAIPCTDAPNSFNTDAQCAKFGNPNLNCMTNGYGCIAKSALQCSSIVNQTACTASLLGGPNTSVCSWQSMCAATVTSCTDTSLSTAALCTSTPVTGSTCVWNTVTGKCQSMSCALLPVTLTTHATCSAALSTCTTTGAGCITLGPCSTYTSAGQTACLTASNKETSGSVTKCIWDSNACRVITCSDNLVATTAAQCNSNGLTGCLTTGAGCLPTASLTCATIVTAAACLKDGANNPCLWINGSCLLYTSCRSVAFTTHAACQLIIPSSGFAPGCTTNGTICIGLNSCTNYTNAASCVQSNIQQKCGWLPANSMGNTDAQCIVFGNCSDAAGKTTDVCQLYGPQCYSNGTTCQLISYCALYTQYACQNNPGLDGACFWQASTSTTPAVCRTQQCGDVTAAYLPGSTTYAGCIMFPAPIINQCRTNGTTCQTMVACASYGLKPSCVMGTNGECFWTTSSTCRTKACTDNVSTTTAGCINSMISVPATSTIGDGGVVTTIPAQWRDCVSNGSNCISRTYCGNYVNLVACLSGGLDGMCAFTPGTNASTPTVGTCAQFSSCIWASFDQVTCNKASDRCFWSSTTNGNVTTTSCSPITCAQASVGTCKPIPSFDYSTYTICAPASATNSTCVVSDGSVNPASTCFSGSLGQFTWNDTSNTCSYCSVTNVTNSNPGSGPTNTTPNATTYGSIIASGLLYGAIISAL